MKHLQLLTILFWAQFCYACESFLPYEALRHASSYNWSVGVSAEPKTTPLAVLISSGETRLDIKWRQTSLPENPSEGKNAAIIVEGKIQQSDLNPKTILKFQPVQKGEGANKFEVRPDITLEDISCYDFSNLCFEGIRSLTLKAAPKCSDIIRKIQITNLHGNLISIHGRISSSKSRINFGSLEGFDFRKDLLKDGIDSTKGFLITGASQVTLFYKDPSPQPQILCF